MRTLLVAIVLGTAGAAAAGSAAAAPVDDLLAFARANADLYASELKPSKLRPGNVVTVRSWLALALPDEPRYDPAGGVATFGGHSTVIMDLHVFSHCVGRGSFVGQNAFGRKVTVKRQACVRVVIEAEDPQTWVRLLNTSFPSTPPQYRAMRRAEGFEIEIDFKIAEPTSKPVVELKTRVETATMNEPVESEVHEFRVKGRIDAVRGMLEGSKAPTAIWRRD